ncbi:MAG: hypothetical protein AAFU65_14325, partial [Pseudomonadota bacterium]
MKTLITALRYPLRPTLLAAIAAFAAMCVIIRALASFGLTGPIVALVLGIFLVCWAIAYGGVVFRSAAQGRAEPPTMTANQMTPFGADDVRGTFVILILYCAVGTFAQIKLAPGLAALTQFLLIAGLPASLSMHVV